MSEECSGEHKRLVRLIREIAREEAHAVVDEHVDEYEHKEKPASDELLDLQLEAQALKRLEAKGR